MNKIKIITFFLIVVIFLPLATSISTKSISTNQNVIFQTAPIIENNKINKIYDIEINNIYQTDFGFNAINFTGWTPPDPIIASGLEHLVVMTNGAIGFFQKDGTKDFQDEIEDSFGFWGEVGATGFVFDPEVIYDPYEDRFMAMACERAPTSQSFFLLAISDDTNPNGDWYKYRLDVTSLAGSDIDSPNIAVDSEAIYLSADFFTGGQKYLVYILEKQPLLSGEIGETRDLLITGSQSYGLPVMYNEAPAMYMIEHFEASTNNKIRLHAITDPLGNPQRDTYELDVPSYSPPENPPQMGTTSRPETFDSRFWSCVYRNGSLWATHHQGSNRVMARWYEIKMNNWPLNEDPELYQSGDIDPDPDIRTFFTAIAADGYGNAAMCFARSSPAEYISIARCTRRADDPLGTMRDVIIIKNSSAPYNGGRWGDYSGISCDASDDITFWMHGEYTPGDNIWNTWISRCTAPNSPPNTNNITGPEYGRPNIDYTFCYTSVDPEMDDLFYIWDWGDGTFSEWLGPFASGEQMCATHSWSEEGIYEIRVKSRDLYGFESDWSDPFIFVVEGGLPEIVFTKPINAIYQNNNKIMPFFFPLIFGYIEVEVFATDDISGIEKVEFYVDNILQSNDTIPPYSWTWSKKEFFRHNLEVFAYDIAGNQNIKELVVLKFF